jgi:hypothetical protein
MIPAIGKAVLGKIAMSVFDKRKKSGGSAFAQMKTPKVSVVSGVKKLSSGAKSRPVRASGSTISKNKGLIGNIAGKGSIRMKATSGLTRL